MNKEIIQLPLGGICSCFAVTFLNWNIIQYFAHQLEVLKIELGEILV